MKSNINQSFRTSIRLSYLDLKMIDEMLDTGEYRNVTALFNAALDTYIRVCEKVRSGMKLYAQAPNSRIEVLIDLSRYFESGGGDLSGSSIKNTQVTLKERFKYAADRENRSVSDFARSALAVSSVMNSYAKDNYELVFSVSDTEQPEATAPAAISTSKNVITLRKLACPLEKVQSICNAATKSGALLSNYGLKSIVVYLRDPVLENEFRLVSMAGVKYKEMMYGSLSKSRRRNLNALDNENYLSAPQMKKRTVRPSIEHRELLPKIAGKVRAFGDFIEREDVVSSAVFVERQEFNAIKSIVYFNFGVKVDFNDDHDGEFVKEHLREVHLELKNCFEGALRQLYLERIDSSKVRALLDVADDWSFKDEGIIEQYEAAETADQGFRDLFQALLDSVCLGYANGYDAKETSVVGFIDWLDRTDGKTLYRAAYFSNTAQKIGRRWGVHTTGESPLSTIDWTITRHGALYLERIEKSELKKLTKATLGEDYELFSKGQLFSIPMVWFGIPHGVMTIAVKDSNPELAQTVKVLNSIGANFCQRQQQHIFIRAASQNLNKTRPELEVVSVVSDQFDAVVSATMRSVGKPSFDIWRVNSEDKASCKFEENYDSKRALKDAKPRSYGWTFEVAQKKQWIIVTGFRPDDGGLANNGIRAYQRNLSSYEWSERDTNVNGRSIGISPALSNEEYSSIGTVLGLPILDSNDEVFAVLWVDINAEYKNLDDLPSSFAIHSLQLWVDTVKKIILNGFNSNLQKQLQQVKSS